MIDIISIILLICDWSISSLWKRSSIWHIYLWSNYNRSRSFLCPFSNFSSFSTIRRISSDYCFVILESLKSQWGKNLTHPSFFYHIEKIRSTYEIILRKTNISTIYKKLIVLLFIERNRGAIFSIFYWYVNIDKQNILI